MMLKWHFLNANPGGHMYIKMLHEMVESGFVTKKEQEHLMISIGPEYVWQCGCRIKIP